MKRVDELGISPMPWHVTEHQDKESGESYFNVNSSRSSYVADGTTMPDKRLIAAAPELYKALHNAIQTTCDGCNLENCEEECRECPRHWWRDVLAKAAGEEKSND